MSFLILFLLIKFLESTTNYFFLLQINRILLNNLLIDFNHLKIILKKTFFASSKLL